ncbi:uncharacterized protein V1513DRAFT_438077 [Lipomyces chichibuensis]|uniref:uncharacterized protein n=1 Tax=Lipomyces chichibuensis TaxID=1546026 RepID=UPI003343216E
MWNHELRFPVLESDDHLKLTVLDDNDSRPELIGDSIIDVKSILQNAGKSISDKWHEIQYRQKYAGEVYIELTFYPNKEHVKSVLAKAHKQEKRMSFTSPPPPPPPPPPKRRPLPASPAPISSSPLSSPHSSPQSGASTPPPSDYYAAHHRHSSSQQSLRGPSQLSPTSTNSRAGIALSSPLSPHTAGHVEENYVSRTPSRHEIIYRYDPTVLQDIPAQYHSIHTLPSDGYNDTPTSPIRGQTSGRRPLPVPPTIVPHTDIVNQYHYSNPGWTEDSRYSYSAYSNGTGQEEQYDGNYYRQSPHCDGYSKDNYRGPQLMTKARSYHAPSPLHSDIPLPEHQVQDANDEGYDPMTVAVDGLARRLEGLGRADGLGRRSTFQSE